MKQLLKTPNSVIIGLSGGVDSAVAAALLVEQGYQVRAVFMRNWDSLLNNEFTKPQLSMDNVCEAELDWQDAQKIAHQLGIPIERIDFIKEYWNEVFLPFLDNYKQGLTPNPDIACNKHIKFGSLLNFIFEKFPNHFLATGHYAQVIVRNEQHYLGMAKDKIKDQTYFLSEISHRILPRLIFPLALKTKEEVRTIAKTKKLVVANKHDSTGICFIGKRHFRKFLKNYLDSDPGPIIDLGSNKIIGRHEGVSYYTIGQNQGLNLSGKKERYFVCGKNLKKQILYVTASSKPKPLLSRHCTVKSFHKLFAGSLPSRCEARFRHRQPLTKVEINRDDDQLKITCVMPQRALTPGQEVVLYHQGICLGGGIIDVVGELNYGDDFFPKSYLLSE